jgi:hypothetical protein
MKNKKENINQEVSGNNVNRWHQLDHAFPT